MRIFLLALFGVIVLPGFAKAEFMLAWSQISGSSAVGSPIVVDLILTETSTTNLNDFGLQNADILVSTSFGILGLPAGNAGFLSVAVENPSATEATITQFNFLNPGTGIGGGNSIVIGTFTVSSLTEGSGFLTVSLLNGGDDDIAVFTDNSFTELNIGNDAFSPLPATFGFTITAVPEPTSMVLVGLVGVAGVAIRARRRIAKKA